MIEKLPENKDKVFKTETGEYLTIPELSIPKPVSNKINELVDAVNELQAQVAILEEHAHPTAKTTPAENVQDRMIGCTTLDIPKSYKNDQLALATLDYSKKLEKENSDLKDEIKRITDILYESKYALEEMLNPSCISHEQQMAQEALDKVNAEIKAITGE